jgi:hypothetical protein
MRKADRLERMMEKDRALAEQLRGNAERLRGTAESQRERSEMRRTHAEAARWSSEDVRRLAEDARMQTETLRRQSECERVEREAGKGLQVASDFRRLIREEVELALQRMRSPGTTDGQTDSIERSRQLESRGAPNDADRRAPKGGR